MKKVFLPAIFVSLSIFLTSCGSTASLDVNQKQEEVANEIASEINSVNQNSEKNAVEAEEAEVTADNSENEIEAEPEVSAEESKKEEEQIDSEAENAEESGEIEESGSEENSVEVETETEPEENSAEAESSEESGSSGEESETAESAEAESAENSAQEEVSSPSQEENSDETGEKVSEEDSNLNKEGGEAPTTDEKSKVSEYQIFEEPEIVVHDLPEAPKEEAKAASIPEEAAPQAEEAKPEENKELAQQAEEKTVETTESPSKTSENQNIEPAPASAAQVPAAKESEVIEESPAEPSESELVTPSRSVNIKINQYLDVTYPGTGWTYIGETDKNDLFNYFGRKLGTKNTTFSLRAKKAGKTILHFYKNDALTGQYIDDYLAVNIENKKSTGRVRAPSYADIVPAKPQRRIDRANENAAATESQTSEIKEEAPVQTLEAAQTKAEPKAQKEAKKPVADSGKSSKNKEKEVSPKSKEAKENKKTSPAKANAASKKEAAPTAARTAPHAAAALASTAPESDIKTVIQNTESTTHVSSVEQSQAAEPAKTQPAAETKPREVQAFNYTPLSSQSEPEEDSQVSSEPVVIVEDTSVVADESLLEKAKKDFADKKFADALKEAQEYYNTASTRLDEALFLLGQISESNSQVRDIRFAVDSYDMLIKRYPASKYWKQAKNRSIYLKRFYIDIR